MGKALTICEYCYLSGVELQPNAELTDCVAGTYSIFAVLTFELKDANKNLLDTYKTRISVVDGLTSKPTYEQALQYLTAANDAIAAKVAAVKLDKSGYGL